MRIEEEDPWGGELALKPLGEILGRRHAPSVLPEDALRQGRHYIFGGEVAQRLEETVMPAQVPGYDEMRLRNVHLGYPFIMPGTTVLDLGTSRGRTIRDLMLACVAADRLDLLGSVTFVGLDSESEMLEFAAQTVGGLLDEIRAGVVGQDEFNPPEPLLIRRDLRDGLPNVGAGSCSLITSVLVLQFVPMEHRQRVVRQVHESLAPGGAFLLVEKLLGSSWEIDDLLTRVYYEDKARNGMSREAIEKKRGSLEGYLVPLTLQGNFDLLEQAGFARTRVDLYWKDLQFAGLIAVKQR